MLALLLLPSSAWSGSNDLVVELPDGTNDYRNAWVRNAYMNIERLTLEWDRKDELGIVLDMAERLPRRSEENAVLALFLDLDALSTTGLRHEGIGAELEIRISRPRKERDWEPVLDATFASFEEDYTFEIRKFKVRKDRITLVIESKAFRDIGSFHLVAETLEKGHLVDRVPNRDHAAFQLFRPD